MTDARDFYDRRAAAYDRVATLPPLGRWRRRTVDSLDLEPGDTVVEMGCGTGGNLRLLGERVGPSGSVVGVDFSRGALDTARQRVAREGLANVHLVHGDATRPPVSEPIDALLATFVVGMFDDPESAVETWCDLVGPGGRLALLNAQRSRQGAAAVLNPAFDWLVGAVNPGPGAGAGTRLGRRVAAARRTLADETVERRYETFAGGFLGLQVGRVRP
ncbi:methyltransferase domain-containing protein [Haloarculaceae archaeon H-GB1-1]|nr:methyltransferase domain-containing protein [Haloarculaceae archaeon H-GB1-1]